MLRIEPKDIWEQGEKRKSVERFTEKVVFSLTSEEADKCRFVLVDQNTRMAECIVHRGDFSHGYRLHPPHLWNLVDGILYKKIGNKWVKFTPDNKANLKRLKESKENPE